MESLMPTLYSKMPCPFGMRARLAFMGANVKCHFRELDAKAVGYEPRMELSNGTVIDNSKDIVKFALGLSDPYKWMDCSDVDDWIGPVDDLFMNAFRVYSHPEAYPNMSWQKEAKFFLAVVESELFKNKGFLDESGKWTVKDALVIPMVYKLSTMDEELWRNLSYPKVHTWLNQFKATHLFKLMMSDSENNPH